MKSINKKLTLSALALACCLSAGVMSLQASATADVSTIDNTGFTMSNGASVYLGTDEEYSGIRWTTNVSTAFYEQLPSNAQFGVIVAPTDALNGQELTHANAETLGVEVATIAQGSVNASETAQTYYSAIDFNDIVEQAGVTDEAEKTALLQQAYAMELTARAYVKVGEEYVYANLDGVNTSRSARQVAIAAELAGEIDEKYRGQGATAEDTQRAAKGVAYYGKEDQYVPGEKSIGAAGTAYVDLEAPDTDVAVAKFEISGDIEEVLIGAERVSYTTYAENTLTIDEANFAPTGEHYVTVFTTDGGIYTKPIIGATKVFDELKDFEDFKYIRKNLTKNSSGAYKVSSIIQKKDVDGNDIDASKLVHDGYYVLAKDLDVDDANNDVTVYDPYDYTYTTISEKTGEAIVCGGYYGMEDFVGKKLGLTGTFNGLGHQLSDYRIRRNYSGLFELINGGTIKNFFLRNAKATESEGYRSSAGLAYFAIDPIIENCSITNTTSYYADLGHYGISVYFYQSKAKSSLFRNVYIHQGYKNYGTTRDGGIFGAIHGASNSDVSWENVYVDSYAGLSLAWDSSSQTVDETKYYTYTLDYAYGEFGEQVADNEDGYAVYNWNKDAFPENTDTKTYIVGDVWKFKGVTVYYSLDSFYADTTKNIAAFNDDPCNCWTWTNQAKQPTLAAK